MTDCLILYIMMQSSVRLRHTSDLGQKQILTTILSALSHLCNVCTSVSRNELFFSTAEPGKPSFQ